MKQILFFTFFLLSVPKTSAQQTFELGKLTENQLNFLKANFNWSDDFLIVNFKQPRANCHYDNYEHLYYAQKWWEKFYAKMDLQAARNVFVFSDSIAAKKYLDMKNKFPDKYNFFLANFFFKHPYCHAVMVVYKNGNYQLKGSEYSQEEISRMMRSLKQ